MTKANQEEMALELRMQGQTYSEILKKVPVAKSTLSRWLRNAKLSKPQQQKITQKRINAQKRGAAARRQQRIDRTKLIKEAAAKEVPRLINDPLWISGLMLYWAEGAKAKPWSPSTEITFANMDLGVNKIMIAWLKKYLNVKNERFRFRVHIHEKADIKNAVEYWQREIKICHAPKVLLKRHNPRTIRKNIGKDYYGTLLIRITKSTDLNRRIAGWTEAVINYFGKKKAI